MSSRAPVPSLRLKAAGVRAVNKTMLDTAENRTTVAATTSRNQQTLAGEVVVSGKGLLLGEEAVVTMLPAPTNHGIVFERTDVSPSVQIPALVQYVAQRARRSTRQHV